MFNEATTSTPDGSAQETNEQPKLTNEQPGEDQSKDVDMSEKLAQLAKRSRFIESREKSFLEKEKDFQTRQETLQKRYSKFEGLDEIENPAQVLEKLGYSLDDILEAALSDDPSDKPSKPKIDPKINTLEQEIKALRDELKSSKEESSKKEEERTIAYQKQILQNMIGKDSEKYPFTNRLGQDAVDSAWETIYSHLQETGELLDYEKVLQEIEDNAIGYLKKFSDIPGFEEKVGLAERLAAAQKAREDSQPKLPKEEEKRLFENDPWEQQVKPPQPSERELSEGEKINESFDHMSDDELLKRAAAQIKWGRTE